jgi:hypothetical protein
MAVREGATDAQIAHALRQGLPHLTAPASLQDRRAGTKPEGAGTSEKGKQFAAQQKKRTRTTSQAPTTQPALLAADGFAAALGALPPDDWSRLAHLDLRYTAIGADGTGRLAGVLTQCRVLAHLHLSRNEVGPDGAESLAGVLGQCALLAHLNLGYN